MKISDELKRNLVADLERICDVKFDDETKEKLMVCYETTICAHEAKFLLYNSSESTGPICKKCGKKYLLHLMKPLTICDKCAEFRAPTDDEIYDESERIKVEPGYGPDAQRMGFQRGAEWMRDLLK